MIPQCLIDPEKMKFYEPYLNVKINVMILWATSSVLIMLQFPYSKQESLLKSI